MGWFLSVKEAHSVYLAKNFPACLKKFEAFEWFFIWTRTRQGGDYWRGKSQIREDTGCDEKFKNNLTGEDKTYLAVLYIADVTGARNITISPKASEFLKNL